MKRPPGLGGRFAFTWNWWGWCGGRARGVPCVVSCGYRIGPGTPRGGSPAWLGASPVSRVSVRGNSTRTLASIGASIRVTWSTIVVLEPTRTTTRPRSNPRASAGGRQARAPRPTSCPLPRCPGTPQRSSRTVRAERRGCATHASRADDRSTDAPRRKRKQLTPQDGDGSEAPHSPTHPPAECPRSAHHRFTWNPLADTVSHETVSTVAPGL